jgi:hypothetical protein
LEGDPYCRARSSGRRRSVDERPSSWCEPSLSRGIILRNRTPQSPERAVERFRLVEEPSVDEDLHVIFVVM